RSIHIMKHMNMALDDVRKTESRMADSKGILKKTRYTWLYSSENLPHKYREKYEILKESDLKTARTYAIKENLRNL
ncbi:transposase IS204/IS1001/IS1096/IS1165 family protein, partial [mine drainage metagenome]